MICLPTGTGLRLRTTDVGAEANAEDGAGEDSRFFDQVEGIAWDVGGGGDIGREGGGGDERPWASGGGEITEVQNKQHIITQHNWDDEHRRNDV